MPGSRGSLVWISALVWTLGFPARAEDTAISTPGRSGAPTLVERGAEGASADEGWLDRVNRADFRLNDWLLDHVLVPVARGYGWVMPRWGQRRIENLMINLDRPRDVVNSLLQLKLLRASSHLGSLVVDSTLGVGGMFSIAERWIPPESPETTNETLGVYHVPMGAYLVLPFFGESCPRCIVGMIGDSLLDPLFWVPVPAVGFASAGEGLLRGTNTLATLMPGRGADESEWNAFEQRIHERPGYQEGKRIFRENQELDISD